LADVFLSYARSDRWLAQRLAGLIEESGRSVWWDREILGGADFERVISVELASAKIILVIWSETSVQSGWVRDEAREGAERGALVPILYGVKEAPMGFRSLHSIDLSGWKGGPHPALTDLFKALGTKPVEVENRSLPLWLKWVGAAVLVIGAAIQIARLLKILG
jgi:adenylate cyclase